MAQGLPEGLIKTNEGFAGIIKRVDRIAEEDIARLWKGGLWNYRNSSLQWALC